MVNATLRNWKPRIFLVIVAVAVALLLPALSSAQSYNYDHVNVTTRVNVTQSFPEILNISISGADDNITLSAGLTRLIYCNATIRDYNGFNDIASVNATFYYYLNNSDDADDNNEHYTNSTCLEIDNDGQYLANYSCGFDIYYYANNGTWNCNISVADTFNFTDSEYNTTLIDPLYALNVTDVIDYGNLSVTDISDNITATITNFGNMDINVSVLGYGQTEGDGLGFVCSLGTNITVGNQKFTVNSSADFTNKVNLTAINQDINATLLQQADDLTPVIQDSYWQLYVPPNPFGLCTGTVRFTATLP